MTAAMDAAVVTVGGSTARQPAAISSAASSRLPGLAAPVTAAAARCRNPVIPHTGHPLGQATSPRSGLSRAGFVASCDTPVLAWIFLTSRKKCPMIAWEQVHVDTGSAGGRMLAISFNSVLIIAGIAVLVPVVLGLLPRLPVPGAGARGDRRHRGRPVGSRLGPRRRAGAGPERSRSWHAAVPGRAGDRRRAAARATGTAGGPGVRCFGRAGLPALTPSGWPGRSQPLLLAIILMSTSAGLLLPLLKDAGEETTEFGQLVMTAAALAEIVPIMFLSLFFSAASKTTEDQLVSLAIFLALLVLIGLPSPGAPAGGPGPAAQSSGRQQRPASRACRAHPGSRVWRARLPVRIRVDPRRVRRRACWCG